MSKERGFLFLLMGACATFRPLHVRLPSWASAEMGACAAFRLHSGLAGSTREVLRAALNPELTGEAAGAFPNPNPSPKIRRRTRRVGFALVSKARQKETTHLFVGGSFLFLVTHSCARFFFALAPFARWQMVCLFVSGSFGQARFRQVPFAERFCT